MAKHTITGTVIRDSLKSFLETSYVVFAQQQYEDWNRFTTQSMLIDGDIQHNHQKFLNNVINKKLSANEAKDLVHQIVTQLNAIGLLKSSSTLFNLEQKSFRTDVFSLSAKGFELALQYKQVDDNKRYFKSQLKRTHWAIGIAVVGSLITALTTLATGLVK